MACAETTLPTFPLLRTVCNVWDIFHISVWWDQHSHQTTIYYAILWQISVCSFQSLGGKWHGQMFGQNAGRSIRLCYLVTKSVKRIFQYTVLIIYEGQNLQREAVLYSQQPTGQPTQQPINQPHGADSSLKSLVPQVVKEFLSFYGTQRLSTILITVCHTSLSWARSIIFSVWGTRNNYCQSKYLSEQRNNFHN